MLAQPGLYCCKLQLHGPVTCLTIEGTRNSTLSWMERSYINTSAREDLRLPTTDMKRLAVAAFGLKHLKPRLCYVVRIKVRAMASETTRVDLFVVPHICESITYQPLAECAKLFPHLVDLELAGVQIRDSRELDILIRADFNSGTLSLEKFDGERRVL